MSGDTPKVDFNGVAWVKTVAAMVAERQHDLRDLDVTAAVVWLRWIGPDGRFFRSYADAMTDVGVKRAAVAGIIARLKAAGLLRLADERLDTRTAEERRRGRDAATYQATLPGLKSTKTNQITVGLKSTKANRYPNKVHEKGDKSPQKRTPTTKQQQLEENKGVSSLAPRSSSAATVVADPALRVITGEVIDHRGFDAFWRAYPKRVAKTAAFKAWETAISAGADPDAIVSGAARYAAAVRARLEAGEDPAEVHRYTKVAKNWLTEARWEDAPVPLPVARRRSTASTDVDAMAAFAARQRAAAW